MSKETYGGTTSGIKIYLKRDRETGQYTITKGNNNVRGNHNSQLYMTKKKAYNCVYPPYTQQNGQYKTRGVTKLERKRKQTKGTTGILQPLNLTFTEQWGISFYILRESKETSLIPWREPKRYRKDKITHFRLCIYGPNNQLFKTKGKLNGDKIKIPKKGLQQKAILRYKIQIGPEE